MSTANIADVDRHKTAVEHLQKQISLIRDPDIAAKFRASFDALQPRSAAALERVREQAASLTKRRQPWRKKYRPKRTARLRKAPDSRPPS